MAGEKSSIERKRSRYTQGGRTDVYPTRLGWWERETIDSSVDDITLKIIAPHNRRPDLVANDYYGDPTLAWIILQYNNILDINTEFVAGKTITIPSPTRVQLDLLNSPIGGELPPELEEDL